MAVAPSLQGIVWGTNVVGMPGAVAPSAPTTQTAPTTFGQQPGAIASNKKRRQKEKQRQQQQQQQQQATTTTSSASAPATDGKTAAEKREEQRQREAARRAAREEARRNRFNPLLTPFKTPAQLREEAIRLAEIGAPSEASLRAQQQQEEAGLTGLTGGLTTALRGISEAQTAGLAGLGSLYQQLGGAAQSAAQSAAAAAGAPTSIAPGVTPTAVQAFPGYGAAVRAYESVAPVIGAQLTGASRANLAKALTQRASQISSDTAKYLQQLQGLEYEKAVAQETARQNAARLGLSAEEAQRDYEIAQANLGLRQQTVAQGWYNAETSRMNAMKTGNKNTDAKNAKKDILGNLDKWTAADSGIGEFEISAQGLTAGDIIGPVKVQATDAASAEARVKELYPDTFGATTNRFNITYAGPAATAGRAPDAVWKSRIRNYMMTVGGMTRAQANAFIKNQVMPSLGL